MKTAAEIRKAYIEKYPHLRYIKDKKSFAKAALLLAAPAGISQQDIWQMAKLANS